MSKPGLGSLSFEASLWRPGVCRSVLFRPEGRDVVYPVPEWMWEQVLACGSYEQAMALLRQGERGDGSSIA